MESVPLSLAGLIEHRLVMTIDNVRVIVKQLLYGLAAMFGARIVHRDLKAENILVRDAATLEVCIADYGLAREVNDDMTRRYMPPAVMSPEVLIDDKTEGGIYGLCDVWSLGCLTYQLLTAQHLFRHR